MAAIPSIYSARAIESIERGGNYWSHTRMGVYRQNGDREEQIGEFIRNYADRPKTFCPFRSGGKDCALYSPFYTATRIMALPSCQDLGGEDSNSNGFCPVEYYIPLPPTLPDSPPVDHYPFGFVGGCYWGDEYQIQYLDLSRATEGIVVRDERTGYIPFLNNRSVEFHINLDDYEPPEAPIIAVVSAARFNMRTGEQLLGRHFVDPQT